MNLILAVADAKVLLKLKKVLKRDSHTIEVVCCNSNALIDYVRLICPDMVIMDVNLPGKFNLEEITKHLNETYGLPVAYLLCNSSEGCMRKAVKANAFGIITDPGDELQVNFTLELVYEKFKESLYLL